MNVALVSFRADPARGGAERYTTDLAAALAARGHAVSLVSSDFADAPEGVVRVHLPARGATRVRQYERFLDALDHHLDAAGYDVVHAMLPVRQCDVYHPHAGLAAEAVAPAHPRHDGPVRQALARAATRVNRKRQRFAAVERTLLTGARPPVVLSLSEYVKGTVGRHYPSLPEGRLVSLFNAVDLARFDPAARPGAGGDLRARLGIDAGAVVGLMIAQDFERKGLAEAVAATALVPDPFHLVVVGKQDPAPWRRLAARAGVAGRITFAGPTTDPYAFYQAADLFVLPTKHDPCSLVVLEALAMGVPVVSTAQNGACEIMTDGVHGFVLPDPDDVPALASAFGELLDPSRRAAAAAACVALRPGLAYERHLERLEVEYARAEATRTVTDAGTRGASGAASAERRV